jgi:hypothetical protein
MAAAVRQQLAIILRLAASLLALLVLAPAVVRRAEAAAPFLPWQKCRNSGSYAANSTYQSNLGKLSATVPANVNASRNLFVADRIGAAPDVVFVLALCRGDINGEPINVMSALNVTSPVTAFDAAVHTLLDAMSNYTAAANSSTRFATGEEAFDSSNPTIYGLTQCTPDMSPGDCRGCLAGLISMLPEAQPGRTGGRLSGLRCTVRYDVYHFFYGTSTLQLPAPVLAPTPSPVTPAATPGGETNPLISQLYFSTFS